MLVLSRKRNEKICIGPNVIVTIVEIIGDRVKIGITAPTDIPVMRTELSPEWRKNRGKNGLERPAT